jgi:hypothetical protein
VRGETSRVFASVVSGANRSEGRDRASVKCLGFCRILIARTAGRLQFRLRRGSQSSLHDDCFDESFVQIFTSSTAIDRVAETPACNILTATTDFADTYLRDMTIKQSIAPGLPITRLGWLLIQICPGATSETSKFSISFVFPIRHHLELHDLRKTGGWIMRCLQPRVSFPGFHMSY